MAHVEHMGPHTGVSRGVASGSPAVVTGVTGAQASGDALQLVLVTLSLLSPTGLGPWRPFGSCVLQHSHEPVSERQGEVPLIPGVFDSEHQGWVPLLPSKNIESLNSGQSEMLREQGKEWREV